MKLERVLVVGAGQMGGGIAQVVAASGRRVLLNDAAPGAVERGLETMRRSLAKLAEKGGADPDEVLARVEPVEDLAAADLIGLDTCVAIMEVLQAGLGREKYAPCPLLRQYVQAGRLGRKSGRGFYEYPGRA